MSERISDTQLVPAQPALHWGQYRLVRRLGAGALGEVWQAEDTQLLRPVALKRLRTELVPQAIHRATFLREARHLAQLHHPRIVTVYQVGEVAGVPYLAMELLQGQTLEQRLSTGQPLPIDQVLTIGVGVAEGLAAVHAHGRIHRDIKPTNLWLTTDGAIKLLDFGLAPLQTGAPALTPCDVIVGTPGYLAPEQIHGGVVGPQTDLFALGCVLYRAATGHAAFAGPTVWAQLSALANQRPPAPRSSNATVPTELDRLILQLLRTAPAQRPPSATAVVAALRQIQPVAPRRRRWGLLAASLAVVAVVGMSLRLPEPPRVLTPEPTPVVVGPDWLALTRMLVGPARWQAVVARLHELHPKLTGTWEPTYRGAQIIQAKFCCPQLQHLEPLAALTDLITLDLSAPADAGQITNLCPLRGLPLQALKLNHHPRLTDLRPLHGLALTHLSIYNTGITDLQTVRALPTLTQLTLGKSPVTDLGPLCGMWLQSLGINECPHLRDLTPLAHLPLRDLSVGGTAVADLRPLSGLHLTNLNLTNAPVRDLGPLRSLPLIRLILRGTRVTDLTPLAECPLTDLDLAHTAVTDLRPLAGWPLRRLDLTNVRAVDFSPLHQLPLVQLNGPFVAADRAWLQQIRTLQTLNGEPATGLR